MLSPCRTYYLTSQEALAFNQLMPLISTFHILEYDDACIKLPGTCLWAWVRSITFKGNLLELIFCWQTVMLKGHDKGRLQMKQVCVQWLILYPLSSCISVRVHVCTTYLPTCITNLNMNIHTCNLSRSGWLVVEWTLWSEGHLLLPFVCPLKHPPLSALIPRSSFQLESGGTRSPVLKKGNKNRDWSLRESRRFRFLPNLAANYD
jgi:hypothetical protein